MSLLTAATMSSAATVSAVAAHPAHSMNDFSFFIGRWDCATFTGTGKPATHMYPVFRWKYADHTVLEESVSAKMRSGHMYEGDFLTIYDRAANAFHTVYADNLSEYGVTESAGISDNSSTEFAYAISRGRIYETSWNRFTRFSLTHYRFIDYTPATAAKPAQQLDLEDCYKT